MQKSMKGLLPGERKDGLEQNKAGCGAAHSQLLLQITDLLILPACQS